LLSFGLSFFGRPRPLFSSLSSIVSSLVKT
jgi:hypothetical protein